MLAIVCSNLPGPLPTALTVRLTAVSPEARASATARADSGASSAALAS
jgi:hypothetical protein